MAHAFTRVTLIGSHRHLDLLLPSDQPVGTLIPQVLDLLQDAPQENVAEKVLLTPSGEPLQDSATLADAGIMHGTVLSLFNTADAPPPAVIYDVTDAVVEETDGTSGRWDRRHRTLSAAVFAAFVLAGAAQTILSTAPRQQWWLLLTAAAVFLAVGVLCGRTAAGSILGRTLTGAGWLSGVAGIVHVSATVPEKSLYVVGLSAATLVAAGLTTARAKPLFSAAGLLAILGLVWAGAGVWTGHPVKTAAIATIVSVLVLGTVPKLALSTSGLAALDDRRANGASIGTVTAGHAIASAHQALALGTAVCAASIAVGLWLLGTDIRTGVWSMPLLLALTSATALRARSFPLAAERISLYLAAAVGVLALTRAALVDLPALPWLVGLLLLLVAAATLVSVLLKFPDHLEARLRLLANKVESIAILAAVPLAVGMFGIFAQLLASF